MASFIVLDRKFQVKTTIPLASSAKIPTIILMAGFSATDWPEVARHDSPAGDRMTP